MYVCNYCNEVDTTPVILCSETNNLFMDSDVYFYTTFTFFPPTYGYKTSLFSMTILILGFIRYFLSNTFVDPLLSQMYMRSIFFELITVSVMHGKYQIGRCLATNTGLHEDWESRTVIVPDGLLYQCQ